MKQGDHRCGVERVLFPQQGNLELSQRGSAVPHGEPGQARARSAGLGDRLRAISGQRIEPVRNRPRLSAKHPAEPVVIRAKQNKSRRLRRKFLKLPAHRLQVHVVIEMLLVHVQQNDVLRGKLAQSAVAFIRLRHKKPVPGGNRPPA